MKQFMDSVPGKVKNLKAKIRSARRRKLSRQAIRIEHRKSNHHWFIVGSVVAFIALVVFFSYLYSFMSTAKLKEAVQKQMASIRTSNIIEAYSYTSRDFQDATSIGEFRKFVNQYPPLKYNLKMTITYTVKQGDEGTVAGKLESKDGRTADVEYHLINDKGHWKVAYIHLTRTSGIQTSENVDLGKEFESKNNYYTIRFPKEWTHSSTNYRKVAFSGAQGTPSYDSMVTIQAFGAKSDTVHYPDLAAVIADVKKQLAEVAMNVKLVEQGDIVLPLNPRGFKGRYLVFTYMDEGYVFKKLQYVLERNDKQAFYIFDYTSPIQQFNADLPVAKAMYGSWNID